MAVKQITTPWPGHLGLGMLGMLGNFPSIPLWYFQFSPLASPHDKKLRHAEHQFNARAGEAVKNSIKKENNKPENKWITR